MSETSDQAALLVLECLVDALIGPRLRAKEIVSRAAALAVLRQHYRVRDLSVREVARHLGISHTALYRRIHKLPGQMQTHLASVAAQTAGIPEKRNVTVRIRKSKIRFTDSP